jgi:hypothetical protein
VPLLAGCIWITTAAVVVVSVLIGRWRWLQCCVPSLLAAHRGWRMEGLDLMATICCRTLYLPFMLTSLQILDGRLLAEPRASDTSLSNETLPLSGAQLKTWSWGGGHPGLVSGVFPLLFVYVAFSSVLLPMLEPLASRQYGQVTVRFEPRCDAVTRTIKLAMAAGVVADVGDGRTAALAALLGCALLVAAALRWPAFEHRWMSRLRIALLAVAGFLALCQFVEIHACPIRGAAPAASERCFWSEAPTLLSGVAICTAAALSQWHVGQIGAMRVCRRVGAQPRLRGKVAPEAAR